jgi:Leucine-rich repeat (LRR) protein
LKKLYELSSILILLCIYLPAIAQEDNKYYSTEEALANSDVVIELQLTGAHELLPHEITKCKKLEVLRLVNLSSDFDLNDTFRKLSGIPTLKAIYLHGNEHLTLPTSIVEIRSLEFLELDHNFKENLNAIIATLSKVKSLKSLSLRGMRIINIPENITSLHIKSLNLDGNPDLNYKKSFELLSKLRLETLNLSSARFSVIPREILKLHTLKRLEIELNDQNFNNEQSFSILSGLPNLVELDIQGNFFGQIDKSIRKLIKLKLLEIDGNCVEGKDYEDLKKNLPNARIQNEVPC